MKYLTTTGALLALAAVSCSRTTPRPEAPPPVATTPATSGAEPAAETGDKGSLSSNAVPVFFPSVVKPCKGEFAMVGDVMKHSFNPELSRITEVLFHDNRAEDVRLEEIADSAANMLGCATTVAKLGWDERDSSWPTFDHFVYSLVTNVSALQLAAMEDDLEQVEHWYQHVKQSCAACHGRFWKK